MFGAFQKKDVEQHHGRIIFVVVSGRRSRLDHRQSHHIHSQGSEAFDPYSNGRPAAHRLTDTWAIEEWHEATNVSKLVGGTNSLKSSGYSPSLTSFVPARTAKQTLMAQYGLSRSEIVEVGRIPSHRTGHRRSRRKLGHARQQKAGRRAIRSEIRRLFTPLLHVT